MVHKMTLIAFEPKARCKQEAYVHTISNESSNDGWIDIIIAHLFRHRWIGSGVPSTDVFQVVGRKAKKGKHFVHLHLHLITTFR